MTQNQVAIDSRLPTIPNTCISVQADVDGVTFLQRIEKLLPQVSDWKFRGWDAPDSLGERLVLTYTGHDPAGKRATDLICQLFGKSQNQEVLLGFRAQRWQNDQLDYKIYTDAACLFKSVLSVYNHNYGLSIRLQIPTQQSLEPSLAPKAQQYFNSFLNEADRLPLSTEA
jgi:hypothetical protein